jgi:site-specific DNA-cytosine methylase
LIVANYFSCQKRDRVYLIASKKKCNVFPIDFPRRFCKGRLKEILQCDDDIDNSLILTDKEIRIHKFWRQARTSINGQKTGALKFPDDINSHCRCLMKTEGGRELTIIPFGNNFRKLSALEYFRLQTFTDSDYFKLKIHFSDSQLKSLMGNSVNINTIQYFIDLFFKNYPV